MKFHKMIAMKNSTKLMFIICFIFPLVMKSQERPRKRGKERIVQLRKNFLAEGIELSKAEEEQFWPIYDRFQIEMDSLKESQRIRKRKPELISDDEATKILSAFVRNRELEMQLHIEFYKSIQEIIPAKQILILNERERLFHKKVFDKVRDRRQYRRGK